MTRKEFSQNLHKATLRSHEKALAFVENDLRQPFTYFVNLNQSFDENQLANGEFILEEMRSKGGDPTGPLSHDDVVDLLWKAKLVPEWIDIHPWEATEHGLIFELKCCGRFAENEPLLYHSKEGYPPFHTPGVMTPPE
ncbi:MAG TPA: hypothetical protein VG347_23320 [Verrucomicrobiae bacterium]|nr:hypothetical protein [Verrucomicrobiae bacterium]